MMATGVARPSAHGQLMTTTATPAVSASLTVPPAMSQTMNVTAAMPSTTGTNTPATLSARRAMGAFVAFASSTSWMILASAVSAPTRVARKVNEPVRFTVAAFTVSPGSFSTGMDSPVSALSSTAEEPSSTTPSTGMDSPGRTTTVSPSWMASTGTVSSVPSAVRRWAVLGARSMSFSMAPPVLDLLRVSRYLPTVTSVRMVPALSRKRLFMAMWCAAMASPTARSAAMINIAYTDQPTLAAEPIAMSASMVGAPCAIDLNPLSKYARFT